MLWLPAASVLLMHAAVLMLPEPPVKATLLHSALPSAVKLTEPLGAVPLTVAVKVTLTPTLAGLSELTSVVVVGDDVPVLLPARSQVARPSERVKAMPLSVLPSSPSRAAGTANRTHCPVVGNAPI